MFHRMLLFLCLFPDEYLVWSDTSAWFTPPLSLFWAACNVWFLGSVELESLTGYHAVQKATTDLLSSEPAPSSTVVHFKVSSQGITLTDNQRKWVGVCLFTLLNTINTFPVWRTTRVFLTGCSSGDTTLSTLLYSVLWTLRTGSKHKNSQYRILQKHTRTPSCHFEMVQSFSFPHSSLHKYSPCIYNLEMKWTQLGLYVISVHEACWWKHRIEGYPWRLGCYSDLLGGRL